MRTKLLSGLYGVLLNFGYEGSCCPLVELYKQYPKVEFRFAVLPLLCISKSNNFFLTSSDDECYTCLFFKQVG